MDFLRPATWDEALAAKAGRPDAVPLSGGTDIMVEINFDHRRPDALLDLNRIADLREHTREGDGSGAPYIRVGAAVPYSTIVEHLHGPLPALALASHTVASPQIRNRGGVGGNLGTASPAGDAHPALLAADAVVEAESAERGVRLVPIDDFYTGVKRNCLAPDELIRAVRVPVADGPQQFSKVGTRNAMVIAVCAFSVALHPRSGRVRTGIGSAAPTPVRARAAEDFLAGVLAEERAWQRRGALPPSAVREFADLVSGAASPIDDVRGTGDYRRHALRVMARRTLAWVWDEYRDGHGDGYEDGEGAGACA
ncbi:carbon monoxide dehydrogenase [Mangrovactinospora gilvigrisea]|uniref:Carbon monoxide dehydrogenase n=1 Tax=Mangrovactinospora gilvigrisea TaxID=1428644 RepID=A0A1J7BSP6_9ACTN|nr:FAD binding domain-containing protein [Mangrovactinospora gilvigrisea]OIV36481.1 carbon monoxide dehydrogenase [Mangrovactinospora gilvigrisea]